MRQYEAVIQAIRENGGYISSRSGFVFTPLKS